jgi:hypothetical protein
MKNVSNTMSLVKVLFEDMSLATNVPKKSIYEQLQVKDALDLHVTLFNTTKISNKGFTFCKHEGNYNQLMPEEIESFLWCLFIHCSLHKNRLELLSGVTSFVYDKSDTVMKPLLFLMWIYWRQSVCGLRKFEMAKNKSRTNPLILGSIDISV